ncbi:hypothetical protein BK658_03225 [Pseudomonas brassicacearum]|uniref:Uncharacterized protein n=1 Tax=Pseudomonas brassicacearum TaxID=930166 RepID=A0A423GZR3_9PSED|nr:hypothetical protein BK658_03225 [Pseudomonas brassicacearum]
MIKADSFFLHDKSKTPPEIGGVFTDLDELRCIRTLSQLKKYTSQPDRGHFRLAGEPCGEGACPRSAAQQS